MRPKRIYQTLGDRNNADEVERQGPFSCQNHPWLGTGCYFWDHFIDLAHWWGRKGYDGSYMICEASYDCTYGRIFDLVGNMELIEEFRSYVEILERNLPPKKRTVGFYIEHLKKHNKEFDYCAIRAYGVDSVNEDQTLKKSRIKFTHHNPAYIDLTPAVQICVIDKKKFGLKDYKVVFPEEYREDFTI